MNLRLGNVNKKTLIRIVVLILVVVVGAGFYFRMQGGGPGVLGEWFGKGAPKFEMPKFLSGFFGQEPPKVSPAPPAPPPKPAPPAPEFPAHVPQGQLLGKPFTADKAAFGEGTLVLRQNRDEVELRVYLPGNKWETPTDKKFNLENASGAGVPRVQVRWKAPGKAELSYREFTENYSLKLEFSPEQNRKLPGKIKLSLPDEGKSLIAGTFEADIQGFRIVNGKPDLGVDSVETLEYLALREILKDDPDKPVQDVELRDGHYVIPGDPARAKTGYLEARYQVSEGAPTVRRFQFIKDQPEWRVLRVLSAGQIAEAHPPEVPTAQSPPEKQMIYQAAVRLEKDNSQKFPTKGIYDVGFTTRHNDKNRLGVCEVNYRRLPGEAPVKTSYLFRQKKGSWVLERELAKTEIVDVEKGVIQKQPSPVKSKPKAKSKR